MKKILFIYSDTGGGHRSSTNALITSLNHLYPGKFHTQMYDGLVQGSIWPLTKSPQIYSFITSHARFIWETSFYSSTSLRPGPIFNKLSRLLFFNIKNLIEQESPDLIVNVHPVMGIPIRTALSATHLNIPFITVVTDLFTIHPLWFSGQPDYCFVPTQIAQKLALQNHRSLSNTFVTGLPVHPDFASVTLKHRQEIRSSLGLSPQLPTILLASGANGSPLLLELAKQFINTSFPLQLIIVCGYNQYLKQQLEDLKFPFPVKIIGYATHMASLMQASDLFITKAGPSTLMEALTVRLPLIVSEYYPGQEQANLDFILKHHLGSYCPSPNLAVSTALSLLSSPGKLKSSTTKFSLLPKRGSTTIARKIHQLLYSSPAQI